jgi:hypothetical protein
MRCAPPATPPSPPAVQAPIQQAQGLGKARKGPEIERQRGIDREDEQASPAGVAAVTAAHGGCSDPPFRGEDLNPKTSEERDFRCSGLAGSTDLMGAHCRPWISIFNLRVQASGIHPCSSLVFLV